MLLKLVVMLPPTVAIVVVGSLRPLGASIVAVTVCILLEFQIDYTKLLSLTRLPSLLHIHFCLFGSTAVRPRDLCRIETHIFVNIVQNMNLAISAVMRPRFFDWIVSRVESL